MDMYGEMPSYLFNTTFRIARNNLNQAIIDTKNQEVIQSKINGWWVSPRRPYLFIRFVKGVTKLNYRHSLRSAENFFIYKFVLR